MVLRKQFLEREHMLSVQERLEKVSFFPVKPDFTGMSKNEKRAITQCVEASCLITEIYLQQRWALNPLLLRELKQRDDQEGRDLLKYFKIHGSPWDGYNHNEAFVPGTPMKPRFGSVYPDDLSGVEWNRWLSAHPEDQPAFESNYTVIKRKGKKLIALPYAEAYADKLTQAGQHLRNAASLLPPGKLKSFLELRASAFRSNDYFESDMAWVDTDGLPFEVTIGPYETYFDELNGLKASFESFIALPDRDASAALSRFSPVVPEFDRMLSSEFNFTPKGAAIPLEVVSDVMRGGEAGFGYFFVAYNLPNDRRIHDLKGSKKVFSATMMKAKFERLTRPIAERIMPTNLVDKCTFMNRLLFVLAHELSHGLGPSKVHVDGRDMPFETALKDLHSALEEAKADMLGVRLLDFFRGHGLIDDDTFAGIIATEITSYFQLWKQGFTEAHSRGALIEYNWLRAADALYFDEPTGRYVIDVEGCITAMCALSTKFLEIQSAGDYKAAKAFMDEWSKVPSEIPDIIESLGDIPISVCPIWDLSGLK